MTMDEAELLDALHDYVRRGIAAGFDDPEEIARRAVAYLEGETDPEQLRVRAGRLTQELLVEHLRAQQGWPSVTDCDRLDLTFAELELDGIVCRQDFSCCGSCGSREIWDEIEQTYRQGVAVRGYAFFHSQDTDAAVDGGGLYLAFGSVAQEDQATVVVGQTIEAALQRNGLRTEWSGDQRKRIYVELEWQRRR